MPSETELQSWIREHAENFLLFLYEADGRLWGQWDTNPNFLARFKTGKGGIVMSARHFRNPSEIFPKNF